MQRSEFILLRFIIAATRKDNTVFFLPNGWHTAAGLQDGCGITCVGIVNSDR